MSLKTQSEIENFFVRKRPVRAVAKVEQTLETSIGADGTWQFLKSYGAVSTLACFMTHHAVHKMQQWNQWMYKCGVARVQTSWRLELHRYYLLFSSGSKPVLSVYDSEQQSSRLQKISAALELFIDKGLGSGHG